MADGIYISLSGAVAETKALDVVAHNVANTGTPGFRAQRLTFAETLARAQGNENHPQVEESKLVVDESDGPLQQTGQPLDLAFAGPGYFALQAPTGVQFTRSGSFHLGPDGTVVSADGLPLLDRDGGSIMIPEGTKTIAIGSDGTVDADGTRVGQVLRARIEADSLIQEGNNLALKAGASVTEDGAGEIVSGSLERANFNAVRGMVELIRLSRSYESLTKMIQSYSDLDQRTVRTLGGG